MILLVLELAAASIFVPSGRVRREVVRPGDPQKRIAVVPVSGVLYSSSPGPRAGRGTADWIVRALESATDDPAVRAVVLEVESPGGSITASDVVHRAVEEFKRKGGRKVVALFGTLAASGGYYVSAPADRIVAHPTSITGSIGAILQTFQVDGLLEKVGVRSVTVKSGEHKDMASPFREMSDDERAMLEAIAREAHERFVSVVARGRGMPEEKVRALADGRIFTASQALEAGLVDELGYFEGAVAAAERLAGAQDATVVRYSKPMGILEILSAGSSSRAPDPAAELARMLARLGPAYLAARLPAGGYVWQGGGLMPEAGR
jgi:protease-4